MSSFNVGQKLDELSRQLTIPRDKLQKVYDKILSPYKKRAPGNPIAAAERAAYVRLRVGINKGYPVSFCPQCPYYTNYIKEFQNHLQHQHGWGPDDLETVRKGFLARQENKGLDYTPRGPGLT